MRFTVSVGQGICSAFPVRLNQPAHAKFDAPEVADHREHDVGQFMRPNSPPGWAALRCCLAPRRRWT